LRPLEVSVCDLDSGPNRYDGAVIKIRARLYSDLGGPYLSDPRCGPSRNHPLVDFSDFRELNSDLRNWLKSIGSIDAPGEDKEADVTIIGRFDAKYFPPEEDALGVHDFRIIPFSLEQNSSFVKRH
jgi:hypothetical protein